MFSGWKGNHSIGAELQKRLWVRSFLFTCSFPSFPLSFPSFLYFDLFPATTNGSGEG